MINRLLITAVMGALMLTGCSDSKHSPENRQQGNASMASRDSVERTLPTNIKASQGIIESVYDAPVSSMISGQIMKLYIEEGQHVQKGQTLLTLDREEAMLNIKELERELEQAKYKLDEILIGQGYKRSEFASVPAATMSYARTKSGYDVSQQRLATARQLLQRSVVKAPITGVCVDVNADDYEHIEAGQPLFHVIDPNHLKVTFKVLQTEVRRFHLGEIVKVSTVAYPEEVHKARISSINQQVNKDGMVHIEAVLEDITNVLSGMSANVSL